MDYSKTRPERTSWRDEKLSKRHRDWGFNCPAIDIDFLMIEYNKGKPVAIVDYKRYTGTIENVHVKSINAITILADNSSIPFFVVYYWDDIWAFRICPVNKIAFNTLQNSGYVDKILTEQEYVSFLYGLRNIKLTPQEKEIIARLNKVLPESLK